MTSGDDPTPSDRVVLLTPDLENLSGFEAALAAGWSPDPRRSGDQAYIRGELQRLRQDKSKFLDDLSPGDRQHCVRVATNGSSLLDLGWRILRQHQPPLSSGHRGAAARSLGHVGYSVVPWKQRSGRATAALGLLLDVAAKQGLTRLVILCDAGNDASRRVIERNGGQFFMPHSSDRPERTKLYFWLHPASAA